VLNHRNRIPLQPRVPRVLHLHHNRHIQKSYASGSRRIIS
jgi:hypothetical protein